MVYVPGSFVKKLYKKAISSLVATGTEDHFLSEGESGGHALKSLSCHMIQREPSCSTTPIRYVLRWPLTYYLAVSTCGMLSVSSTCCYPQTRSSTSPPSYLAFAIRHAIKELDTHAQVEASASVWRESRGKISPIFGNCKMHMIIYTKLRKARLFETDFSAAAVTPGRNSTRPRMPLYPEYLVSVWIGSSRCVSGHRKSWRR